MINKVTTPITTPLTLSPAESVTTSEVTSPVVASASKVTSLSTPKEEVKKETAPEAYQMLLNAGDGIFNLVSSLSEKTSGFSVEDLVDLVPRYTEVKAEIENIKQKLADLPDTPENKATIEHLKEHLSELENEKFEIDTKFIQRGSATVISAIVDLGIGAIPVISALAGSAAIKENYKAAQAINKEIEGVKQEIENEQNPAIKNVLNLRLNALNQQAEENKVAAVRNFSKLSGVIAAFALPEVAAGLEIGIETAAALGALSVSTGVGICIFVGFSVLAGGAYVAYKNKDAINNKIDNMKFDFKAWQATEFGTREQSLAQLPVLKKEMSFLGHVKEDTTKVSDEENAITETIYQLQDQLNKFEPGSKDHSAINDEIRELTKRKTQLTLNRAGTFAQTHATIINKNPRFQNLKQIETNLQEIGNKRQAVNDDYQYGRHLKMFNDTSVDTLKNVEKEVQEMSPEDYQRLQERFGIKGEQKSPHLMENVVKGVTQKVEAE